MPRLPTYQPGSVEAAPMPGVRQAANASADMFFNDGGAGAASKVMFAIADIADKETLKIDEARVQDKYAQLARAGNESIYGKEGVTTRLGANAIGVADKWLVDFDKTASSLTEDMTPRQKAMFAKYSTALRRGFHDNALRHETGQVRAYEDESYKNLIGTSMESAAANPRDGLMIGMQTGIAIEAMRKRPEYAGASPEVKATMERDLRAGFHAAVIQRSIQLEDVEYANEYFDSVKEEIPLKFRSKIEGELKPVTDFANGKALALEVERKIASGEMSVTEGERYIIEKSKTKDAASVAQSIMREMQDAARREADTVTGSLIEKFEMRPSHGTMNTIMGTPEFRAMTPDKRASVLKYMRSELEQADDRSRARRNEQYRSPQNYSRFLEILESPQFSGKSREELFALQPELGPDLTRQLLAEHKSQQGTAAKFQIDKDLLNEAMPASVAKDKDKTNAFRGIVESELQRWKMQNPGKVPTLDEQKQIARSANTEYIDIGRVWNSSGERYKLENDPTAVPKDFYNESKAWAARQGKNLTDAEILAAWRKMKGAQ